VTFDPAPGLVGPGFNEKPFGLRHPKLRPTFGCTLLFLQAGGALTGGPKVNNFRHVNDRRCPDASVWVGTDPLIEVNYADTVALDHSGLPPLAVVRPHPWPDSSFWLVHFAFNEKPKLHKGSCG